MKATELLAAGRLLGNIYADLAAPICKKHGINQTCFDLIMFCANNPERNTARDACELRGLKSGMASVAVDTLIAKGLMTRCDDPFDRRLRRLVPTQSAAPLIADGRRMQREFAAVLTVGIPEEELSAAERTAAKIAANINAFVKGEKQ